MRRILLPLLSVVLAVPLYSQQQATLRPFESDSQLLTYFHDAREAQERARIAAQKEWQARQDALNRCRNAAAKPRTTHLGLPVGSGALIRGRVTDEQGRPQPATAVVVSGMQTSTDDSGRYRVNVPADSLKTRRAVYVRTARIGFSSTDRLLTLFPRVSVDVDLRLCAATVQLEGITVAAAQASISVDGAMAARGLGEEQITNVQHAGVDEGGIVKVHGDYLVILRRGRLITVAIGGSELKPTAAADAFGPDVNPRGTWYDELLVSRDKVVVIGYSYDRGGTELGVFNIDDGGHLTYAATYQLRSNDYYSDRNYASRLIGTKLIFYAPLYLWGKVDNLLTALPAVRRWSRGAKDGAFRRIAPADRVYRSPVPWGGDDIALHTVTVCDLATPDLGCQATVVVGPSGRVFYVSPHAVYIWASAWSRSAGSENRAMLYRMPLDGSAPSALGVSGSPVDQFSFLETDEGHLNVVVRSDALGDAMWLPEFARGDVALLRVPLQSFGDGSDRVPWWRYHRLPAPNDSNRYSFQNRFVGGYLLYGMGSGWGRPRGDSTTLFLYQWTRADSDVSSTRIRLPHGVDRIEVMGDDAIIVGTAGDDLHFSGIRIAGTPRTAQHYVMADASQGELRSQGFFYRRDSDDAGVLALPVRGGGRAGWRHLIEGSAGVLFLANHAGRFDRLGVLAADAPRKQNDACRASCVDWYGNARPLFLHGRVFALLGYELVEGRIAADSIREMRRVNFSPGQ